MRFILDYHQVSRISIIAHSWGTIPAGLFARRFPELIERVVFFAPIAQRTIGHTTQSKVKRYPAWSPVSLQEQWDRFVEDIEAPVSILRGEWDHLVTDHDALWLFQALKNSPLKRDVKISHATHLMHLESGRFALYREPQTFLEANDQAQLKASSISKSI